MVVADDSGAGDPSVLGGRDVLRYDEIVDAQQPGHAWPEVDETSAAMMCHTSGTTGDPRGVVHSHRSQWIHAVGQQAANGMAEDERLLVIVPQFHANAWGLVHACWAVGADLLQPGPHLQPEPLVAFIEAERPTHSAGVPTVWNGVLQLGAERDIDLSSLEQVTIGGAAVPRSLIRAFRDDHGVDVVPGWGMTEMSPLGALAIPPSSVDGDDDGQVEYRARNGRIVAGVEVRLVAVETGEEQPVGRRAHGRGAGARPVDDRGLPRCCRQGDVHRRRPAAHRRRRGHRARRLDADRRPDQGRHQVGVLRSTHEKGDLTVVRSG